MKRKLADVNLLFAMLWSRHAFHDAAQAWFERSGRTAWATSPLTQLGVLRLLTNPAVVQGTVTAALALHTLREATEHPGHEYWPLGPGLAEGLRPIARGIGGHQQWTDAALLWQAVAHDGVLVTFDEGIAKLAAGELRGRVQILKPGAPGT